MYMCDEKWILKTECKLTYIMHYIQTVTIPIVNFLVNQFVEFLKLFWKTI